MSENVLLELLSESGNVILQIDAKGTLLDKKGQNSFSELFPIQLNIPIFKQVPAELSRILKHELEKALGSKTKQLFTYTYSYDRTDHVLYFYFIQLVKNMYLIVHTADENKDLALELQRSEAKFRIVIESASQGILLMNMHGRITLVNSRIEQIFGYDRDELMDTSVESLISPVYRDIHQHHRNGYLLNPTNRAMAGDKEISGKHKNGDDIPLEISLSPIELYDGFYVIAFITDTTERNKLQNRIRRMEKLEAIGQLAGGIAHDFNNVLAGIIGLTELALRKIPEDSKAISNLKMVIDKSQNAAGLVKQLLAFSRQQILSKQSTNLNHIIKLNTKMLQRYLGEDILLKTNLDQNLESIFADSSAIDQIITNLCINARDAMPDGGELEINTRNINIADENISIADIPNHTKFVKLTIHDNGIGMRKEVQQHMFEPFYSTKAFGQGTGLGLSTVYGLVEQHDGLIQVESIPGEGSWFYIYFPIHETNATNSSPDKKGKTLPKGTETILVVDDEKDILYTISETLQYYGYKILTATDGVEAMKVANNYPGRIHLVISDLVMPNRGGVELKLLIERIDPKTSFLHISGYSEKINPDTPYLKKPFIADELVNKVREILDE